MPAELLSRVVYPAVVVCTHCGAGEGHEEVVWTGDDVEDYGGQKCGWELWFCCHACRDTDQPCETFYPLRLKSDAASVKRNLKLIQLRTQTQSKFDTPAHTVFS
jgi:hypothetical protein